MKTDSELRSDVMAELRWDSRIKSNQIGVIVKDGAVTLNGMVETYAEKMAAERAAKRVRGVRAIAEDIEVRLPNQMRATDEGLAEQIARVLSWNSLLGDTSIQAEVRNGRVMLSGHVDSHHQREAAAAAVEPLQGVAALFNYVTVRPPAKEPAPRDVERQIMSALHRHANVEASKIQVSVAGGKVMLDGSVDAYCEREVVDQAVRSTPGVREVVDNIVVTSI